MRYGLNYRHFYATLSCESDGFKDVAIQSRVPDAGSPNGYEQSYGLAQIYLPAHPDVTKTQAENPAFALDYAGKMFSDGNQRQFHCYGKMVAHGWK